MKPGTTHLHASIFDSPTWRVEIDVFYSVDEVFRVFADKKDTEPMHPLMNEPFKGACLRVFLPFYSEFPCALLFSPKHITSYRITPHQSV
jgi:hypothetical protein